MGLTYSKEVLQMEIYRKIKETKYSISNLGNVRNDITGKILKKNTHKKTGYEQVTLRIEGKSKVLSVHRLVCLEFIEAGIPHF